MDYSVLGDSAQYNCCMDEKWWFIFCGTELLLTLEGTLPIGVTPPLGLQSESTELCLPLMHGLPCRAMRIDRRDVGNDYRLVDLRASYSLLSPEAYAMAGKSYELLYWDASSQFCGVCGTPMGMHDSFSKQCPGCGREVWPALAPAIIVGIRKGREILLVQGRNFTGAYMGLVAGFVETGESLEDCVHREVMEETGLIIENLRYFGSQPWPYPSGLLVGFMADYVSGDLKLQTSELRAGGWYDVAHLPTLPERLSLTRKMLDAWADEQREK